MSYCVTNLYLKSELIVFIRILCLKLKLVSFKLCLKDRPLPEGAMPYVR